MFRNLFKITGVTRLSICLFAMIGLSACTFQPLYAPSTNVSGQPTVQLSQVGVSEVDTRVGQQVRNHLLFLLHGGNDYSNTRYEARLQITSSEQRTSAQASLTDTTAGFVTVRVRYSLIDLTTNKRVSNGNRRAVSSFDRTTQSFANLRAVRDAENKAGKEVAEMIRFAIASDLRK